MTILSDKDLREAVSRDGIVITREGNPVDLTEFRGCSIDLTLSNEFYRLRTTQKIGGQPILDLAAVKQAQFDQLITHEVVENGGGMKIRPNEFVLGRTVEQLRISGALAGLLTGRSSYSRIGLSIELSQNLLCPGHNNVVPIQLKNNTPFEVVIYPGTPICQIVFFQLSSPAELPYNLDPRSKYTGRTSFLSQWYRDMNIPGEEGEIETQFNWKQFLNYNLLIMTVLSIAAITTSLLIGEEYASIANRLFVLPCAGLLGLTFIARTVLFFKELRAV